MTKQLLEKNGTLIYTPDKRLSMPIHVAAINGNNSVMKMLCEEHVKKEFSLNLVNSNSLAPLHLASRYNHPLAVRCLLQNGAKADIEDDNGVTPLHIAARDGRLDIFRHLIEFGADITATNSEGCTSLHLASERGHVDLVHQFLEAAKGQPKSLVNIAMYSDMMDSKGRTALLLAVRGGHMQTVQALCKEGRASLKITEQKYPPLLHIAVEAGHLSVVEYLVSTMHVDVNSKVLGACESNEETDDREGQQLKSNGSTDTIDNVNTKGQSALHVASEKNHIRIIEYLLKKEANPRARNQQDMSPIDVSTSAEAALLLLQDYGSFNRSEKDATLLLAADRGYSDIVRKIFQIDDKELSLDIIDNENRTPLIIAAAKGHLDIFKLLLDSNLKVDRDYKDKQGRTALSYSCQTYGEIANELLDRPGTRVDTRDKNGRTPLSYAAESGLDSTVLKLLEALRSFPDSTGAHIEDDENRSPLWYASRKGHNPIVRVLLDNDGNPNIVDTNGMGPLHVAADNGHVDVVKTLLASKSIIDINAPANDKSTALLYASLKGKQHIVQTLIDEGADPNLGDENRQTPLHGATQYGYNEVVKVLLDSKNIANANARNSYGRTPLFLAAYYGSHNVVPTLVEYLVKNKLALDVADLWGWSPLHAAYDNLEITQHLLKSEAVKVDSEDNSGGTALLLSVINRYDSVARELLQHGADPLVKPHDGETALHVACEKAEDETVKMMLPKLKGRTDILEGRGESLLRVAVDYNRYDVVKLLLEQDKLRECITKKDDNGNTVIHVAAENGNAAIVQELISNIDETSMTDEVAVDLLGLAANQELPELRENLTSKLRQVTKPGVVLQEFLEIMDDPSVSAPLDVIKEMRGFGKGIYSEGTDEHGWRLVDLLAALKAASIHDQPPDIRDTPNADAFKPPRGWDIQHKSDVLEVDETDPFTIRYNVLDSSGESLDKNRLSHSPRDLNY